MPINAPLPKPAAMPKPASPAAKLGLGLVIGLVIGLIAGYGVGRLSIGGAGLPFAGKGGSYQEGWDAAKKKLAESGLILAAPSTTTSITGTIKSISGDKLVLAASLRNPNPLDEKQVPTERSVTVGNDTKITVRVDKDPAAYRDEVTAFQKAQAAGKATAPPLPFTVKDISLADLKEGDSVTVTAAKDIFFEAAFDAVSIEQFSAVGLPATGAPVPPPVAATPPAPGAAPAP